MVVMRTRSLSGAVLGVVVLFAPIGVAGVAPGDGYLPGIAPIRLSASIAEADAFAGNAVALDGDSAAMGLVGLDGASFFEGGVDLLVRQGGSWILQQHLPNPMPNPGSSFGTSLAIEGDTLAVGASSTEIAGVRMGAVFMYTRNVGIWTLTQTLTPSDGAELDFFGRTLSLEGDRLAVSSVFADGLVPDSGVAYIFERSAGVWSQVARLQANDAVDKQQFGFDISLSGDSVVIGARDDSKLGLLHAGAGYVFQREAGGSWVQQARLEAPDPKVLDQLGLAVAMAGDTLMLAAPGGTASDLVPGRVLVYTRNGSTWSFARELTDPKSGNPGFFGSALSLDAGLLAVSDTSADALGVQNAGAVYLYSGGGADWDLLGALLSPEITPNEGLGSDVMLDGDRLIMGDSNHDQPVSNAGQAWFVEDLLIGPALLDLGHGLAGAGGTPLLGGAGPLLPGSTLTLSVSGASPGALAFWIIGSAQADLPIKGGVLVPTPDFAVPTATDGLGALSEAVIWPTDLPPGYRAALQAWILDASAPQGVAASNGLAIVGP